MSKRKNNLEEKMKKRKEEILKRRAKRRAPPSKGREFHPPFYNFMGPGTNIGDRLSLNYEKGGDLYFLPISRGDKMAFSHDLRYYSDSSILREYADSSMITEIYARSILAGRPDKTVAPMSKWDDIFAWGIVPVRNYRRIKDFVAPLVGAFGLVRLGEEELREFGTSLKNLIKAAPSPGRYATLYRELFGVNGKAPRAIRDFVRSKLGGPRGGGTQITFRREFLALIPYIIAGMTLPIVESGEAIINLFSEIIDSAFLNIEGGEEFNRELTDVENSYEDYLNSVGYFDEKGFFQLKDNINEEEARQNYLNFFGEYRDYISFVNKRPEQTTKYDLPKLNKLNLDKVANPKKYEGEFRNIIQLPPPENLKGPKPQDFNKEDFIKIMEGSINKSELILENRKKNIVEDIKPMETLEDTVSQLKESAKTTARGMGFNEVYNWLTGHKRKKGSKISDWEINKWSGFYNDVVKPAASALGIKTKKTSKNKNKSAQVKNNIKNSKDAIEAIKKRVDAEGTGVLTKIEDFFQTAGSYMGVARVMPYETQKTGIDQLINAFKKYPMSPEVEKVVEKLERGKLETLNPKTYYDLIGEGARALAVASKAKPIDPEVIQKKDEDEEIVFGKGKRFEPEQPKEVSRVEMEKFLRSKGHQAPNTWTRKEVEDVYMQEIFGEPPEGPVKIPKSRIPKKSREDKISYLRKFGYERDDLANLSLTDLRKLYVKTYGEKGPAPVEEPSAPPKVEPSPAPAVEPTPAPAVEPTPAPRVEPVLEQPAFVEEPVKPLKEPVQKVMDVPTINDQVKPSDSLEPFNENITAKEALEAAPSQEEQLRSMNNWQTFDLPITENIDKNVLYQMARKEEMRNLTGPLNAWYDFTRRQYDPVSSYVKNEKSLENQAKFDAITNNEAEKQKLMKEGPEFPSDTLFTDTTANPMNFKATTEAQIAPSGNLSDSPYNKFSITGLTTGSLSTDYNDLRKNINLYIVP